MPIKSAVGMRDFGGPAQFGAVYEAILGAKVTIDPNPVAVGATGFDRFTVPGVRLGDMVIGMSIDRVSGAGGMTLQAMVVDADTVEVRYNNLFTASVDLQPFTLRIVIGRTPL